MGTKKSVKATTTVRTGSKVVNEYTEEMVLKSNKWDSRHVNAIKSYFKHQPYAKSEGEKPVIKAKDTEDLLKKVEVIFINYTCAKIAELCKTTLKNYPKLPPELLYRKIRELLYQEENAVRKEAMEMDSMTMAY